MAAGITDVFTKVGLPGNATSLASPGHAIAGTVFTVDSTSLWPTDTAVIFGVDIITLVNGTEVRTAGSYTVWRGIVSSATTITGAVLMYGTDQTYPAGSSTRVYILPTSSRENRIVDGLLVSLNNNGTVKTDVALTTPKITTGIKDAAGNTIIPMLGSSSTTSIKLATTAVGPTYVESGCVWTGDAYASTRNASMTSGVLYINGVRLTTAPVTARAFTASKDTYVDFTNNGDGTALVAYTEVINNAASPALASSGLRGAIIVSGVTSIASVGSVNQGSPTDILPITSSIAYSVTDSLGNLIYPTSPQSGVIGYRQIVGNVTATTIAQATGLSCPVIVPAGRKVKISIGTISITNSTANASISAGIWDGTVGVTQLMNTIHSSGTVATDQHFVYMDVTVRPSLTAVSSKTYNVGIASSGGTVTLSAAPTAPAFIKVELV